VPSHSRSRVASSSLSSAKASAPSPAPVTPVPVSLAQLQAGTMARMHAAQLTREDCALLRALGLSDRCLLRVCKAGEPCIVQVRATRIGLSRELARSILVIPEAAA
jgi:Fe2+ transport system protein FeoA